MQFGCCANMNSKGEDKTGIEVIEQLRDIGYDYIELPLAQMMELSDKAFITLRSRVEKSGLACKVCNNFLPSSIKLVGKDIRQNEVMDYVHKAVVRAESLGVGKIVFGSSGSRNIPVRYPREEAWKQLVDFLSRVDGIAGQAGITVVIEPLNKIESNIINTAAEAFLLAQAVNCDHVRVLLDYYHMSVSMESADIVLKLGKWLRHVHFARPMGRLFPIETEEDEYEEFFHRLKEIGYNEDISIEGYTQSFEVQAPKSLELLNILHRS